MGAPSKIPKKILYPILEESRLCGVGPRELGRALGYSHEQLSRIAVGMLGLRAMPFRRCHGVWSDRLRQMVVDATGDIKTVAKPPLICQHCGGIVRPEETQAGIRNMRTQTRIR